MRIYACGISSRWRETKIEPAVGTQGVRGCEESPAVARVQVCPGRTIKSVEEGS
jgi:hypothetical protein